MLMSLKDKEQESARIRLEILQSALINGKILPEIYEMAIKDVDMLLGKKDMCEYYPYPHSFVSRRLINVMNSKNWSDSFCRGVRNFTFNENCISVSSDKLEDYIDLGIAINSLSSVHADNQEKILTLYFQGYKFTEIAKQIGFSDRWVKELQRYAIKEMRDYYAVQGVSYSS